MCILDKSNLLVNSFAQKPRSRAGYQELPQQLSKPPPSPLWVNDGVFTEEELSQMRREGIDITNFNYFVNANDPVSLRNAIHTIQDHHDERRIWVETLKNL